MLLLLLMYFSPLLAASLYWYAQRTASGPTAWEALGTAAQGRAALLRPTAGAFVFAAGVAAVATGTRGGVAFLVGALTAAVVSAIASSTGEGSLAESEEVARPEAVPTWAEASSLATSIAAVTVGAVGALAWFFADPSGAVVLATFAAGASAASLFLAMIVGTIGAEANEDVLAHATIARLRELSVTSTASLHAHLPALAATLMIASTAEPESLLPLGGLLAETETLRSELLLLPIAVTILAPIIALLAAPVLSSLGPRRGDSSLYDVERVAAGLSLLAMMMLVTVSGLSWSIVWAFGVGLVARQLGVIGDEARGRTHAYGRPSTPSVVPAVVSATALLLGDYLAGWYGIAMAALGMTATYASAAACAATRELAALTGRAQAPADLSLSESTSTVAATLALLVAAAPAIAAFSAQRGTVPELVVTAVPALLIAVVAGAACAEAFSRRYAEPSGETEAVRHAAEAVAIAAGLPALAGVTFGGGAAVGVALGFAAWAVAARPSGAGSDSNGSSEARMPSSVLLAWGRTMALAALVGAPFMG